MKSRWGAALVLLVYSLVLYPAVGEPLASFFDGHDHRNECKPRLDRRISGVSGILYSHSKYGKESYNSSRNCVLMLVAPVGYQIRVRALNFEVNTNDSSSCEKDTLHIFDHETTVDPESYAPPRIDDITSPGPIIGQFCGQISNRVLNSSTQNALTLWWHANPESSGEQSKGFKLHWNAFRSTKRGGGPCDPEDEFSCGNDECIPMEVACDKYADCFNGADLIHSRQMEANCQNVDLDPITSVSGVFVLLFSAAVILSCCCTGILICYCCRCAKAQTALKSANSCQTQTTSQDYKPEPPQFYPPSPPKMPPPSAASSYTPRKQIHFDPTIVQTSDGYRTPRAQVQFAPTEIQGDYTYVRNEVHRQLI